MGFFFPDLRGPNTTPDACGSELVTNDAALWVDYAKERCTIDTSRIYLIGESGGGHLAALLAGRLPRLWAGVSCWCGMMDLADWYAETLQRNLIYYRHLETVCSGKPNSSTLVDREYRQCSPMTWLPDARAVPLSLCHGIHDGHDGASVPVSQSIRAFNRLATEDQRVSDAQIDYILTHQRVPPELMSETVKDETFIGRDVLFRRTSGNVTLTIFDGGHESIPQAGLLWLKTKQKR